MAVLANLQPKEVFAYFEEICAIPHGSENTTAIADYLVSFAKEHNLEHYRDALNNVIIIKEATPGYENAEPVIIQGHTDMVCEKTEECTKDMEKEGLDLVVDGDTIYAEGTTLGGDDGIAVAMGLAVLASKELSHSRVEVVLTVDEETGMDGARGLDVSPLKGRRMLNIDSEDEGIFTVSCSGGSFTECTLKVERAAFTSAILKVEISGLVGGHSGVEIHTGRANANVLLGRVLSAMQKVTPLRIITVRGGLKDNAIPVQAAAIVAVADKPAAEEVAHGFEEVLRREYAGIEPNLTVRAFDNSSDITPMTEESTRNTIAMLERVPNGIQSMSRDIEGLVQTSLNNGILKTDDAAVRASLCVRSSVDAERKELEAKILAAMESVGGTAVVKEEYPGWAYAPVSPTRDLLVEVFTEQYGYAPKLEAIHAGLECGLFAGKIPGLDCISFGPELTEIHTPRERMGISSVGRVWNMLVETLKRMK